MAESASPGITGDRTVLRTIFDHLPHVLYCEKDDTGAYVAANRAFALRCSVRGPGEVIGRRASDLFAADLAASYEAQDRAVVSTGRSVVNHLEVIGRADGHLGWFLTTKVRMTGPDNRQFVVVVSVDLNAPVDQHSSLDNLSGILTAVRSDPGRAWRVGQLAAMAAIGERQLERRMQRLLGCSVKAFLQSVRIERAAELLISSTRSLAEIAEMSGYYDQSQFSRHFRSAKGVTPGQYRRFGSAVRIGDGVSSAGQMVPETRPAPRSPTVNSQETPRKD